MVSSLVSHCLFQSACTNAIPFADDPLALPSDPGPFPDEHHEIENEITGLFTAIYKLRSRQNTFSRICRLPPEILSQIFIFTTFTNVEIQLTLPLSLIRVTHVCRHFRAVALECPALWTEIYFPSTPWATEMLKRSKGADLILNFRKVGDRLLFDRTLGKIEPLKEALTQVHRIQDIELNAVATAELNLLFADGFQVEAPKLRSLSIKKFTNPYAITPIIEPRYTLPSKFLCDGAPQLQRLELVGCCLPWQDGIPNLFTSCLTTLVLSQSNGNLQQPTLPQLLDVLETLPLLQRLELEYTLPITPDDVKFLPRSGRVISLSRLQRFRLKGACLECASLINALSFPIEATIKVDCDPPKEWLGGCSALMDSLTKCRGSALKPKELTISGVSINPPSFRITMWDKVETVKTGKSLLPCSLDVDLKGNIDSTQSLKDVLHVLLSGMDLDGLQALEALATHWTKNMWGRYFGRLPQLSRIRLSETGAEELIAAMAPRLVTGTRSQVQSKMYFRALKSLTLDCVQFDEDDSYGLVVDKFIDTLMLRAEYGADLHELVITGAVKLIHEDVDLLKEVVALVEWDGVVDDGYDDEDYDDEYSDDYSDGYDYPY